jgi:hypothetical protein
MENSTRCNKQDILGLREGIYFTSLVTQEDGSKSFRLTQVVSTSPGAITVGLQDNTTVEIPYSTAEALLPDGSKIELALLKG